MNISICKVEIVKHQISLTLQEQKVLEYLINYHRVTRSDFCRDGIKNLSAIIAGLRKKGIPINSVESNNEFNLLSKKWENIPFHYVLDIQKFFMGFDYDES